MHRIFCRKHIVKRQKKLGSFLQSRNFFSSWQLHVLYQIITPNIDQQCCLLQKQQDKVFIPGFINLSHQTSHRQRQIFHLIAWNNFYKYTVQTQILHPVLPCLFFQDVFQAHFKATELYMPAMYSVFHLLTKSQIRHLFFLILFLPAKNKQRKALSWPQILCMLGSW